MNVTVYCYLDRTKTSFFSFSQVWMPHVNYWKKSFREVFTKNCFFTDKNKPQTCSVVPNLVLKTVIKYQPVTFFPRSRFFCDSNESLFRNLQAQMASNTTICRSAMAENMSSGMENAELHLTSFALRSSRKFLDNFARHRCKLAVFRFCSSRV